MPLAGGTAPEPGKPAPPARQLKSGAARARQGRGLSGRVGDVAAQGRSVAKALPHDRPDRAAVGLTDQADDERGTPVPRAPGHGLAFARGEAPAPGKRWSGDGFATGQAGDSEPGNLADAEHAPVVMRRPGVARTDWRGACDQPAFARRAATILTVDTKNSPFLRLTAKPGTSALPTWPAPHRPPAAGVAGAGAALAPSPAGERRPAGVALADGWPGRGGKGAPRPGQPETSKGHD